MNSKATLGVIDQTKILWKFLFQKQNKTRVSATCLPVFDAYDTRRKGWSRHSDTEVPKGVSDQHIQASPMTAVTPEPQNDTKRHESEGFLFCFCFSQIWLAINTWYGQFMMNLCVIWYFLLIKLFIITSLKYACGAFFYIHSSAKNYANMWQFPMGEIICRLHKDGSSTRGMTARGVKNSRKDSQMKEYWNGTWHNKTHLDY